MPQEIFRADAVFHDYGDRPALRNLELVVRPGEFVVVLGRNGSGKSTLARHLNALLQPTAGRVFVMGLPTDQPELVWTIRQHVGMVFQNPDNQLVGTTVEEDAAFGPENLGLPSSEIAGRVEGALAAVGLSRHGQEAPHRLSGGQKQRVAIAGVLAMQPAAVVLDEPTSMLDPAGREEVLQTIRRLHRTLGLTVIYITHDLRDAVDADRVIVLDAGRVAIDGPPREVFAQGDHLRALGLDAPLAVDLTARLRARGVPLPEGLLTTEDLAEALCQLKSAR